MRRLWKSQFSLWDLMGALTAFHLIFTDLNMWPIVAILGFLWIFVGVCMEKAYK